MLNDLYLLPTYLRILYVIIYLYRYSLFCLLFFYILFSNKSGQILPIFYQSILIFIKNLERMIVYV